MATSEKRKLSVAERHQKAVNEKFFKKEQMQEQIKQGKQVKIQKMIMENDERIARKRILRLLQDEQFELDMEEAIQKAEENKRVKAMQLEQEQKLATELAKLKNESLKDEKMRQQIRENSLELRELEQKLKAAYMNKERAAQIAEKEAINYEKMKRDSEIARCMKEEQERYTKEQNEAEARRYKEKIQYQRALERQLEDQERKKQEAYEELLREKLMIDEIVKKVYEEDRMERQQQLEKMAATHRYIEEFKKEQALWRMKKREELEEENRKILEFATVQQRREEDRMAQAQKLEEKRQQYKNLIAQHLAKIQQQQDDMEQVRLDLYEIEQAELDRKKAQEEIENKIKKREELQRNFAEQMAFKELVLQATREEEELFRQNMLAKFAEDDRIELMNAQKQRMKQYEHRKAIEKLIKERHEQFLADKEREFEEMRLQQQRDGGVNAIVEEERQKLLREHAANLLGYLPKGVIKHEQDVDMLGEAFRKAYLKSDTPLDS
ncbi:meiosis-specific nuclear structural protein 1 [Dromiciops gliroides]|uniref:meiosis-specific nuclear structural protein 1 n=1 Tax=Dromiciops gliroides TaxID=33562 RepID=UPI001CC7A383|nr:meiosis-specific nuclear structural protein 1 [Dromiciops gliroides]